MNNFEENNWSWQLQQWGQQFGEWWELQTQGWGRNLSKFTLPDWLKNLGLPAWIYQLILWICLGIILLWLSWQFIRFGIPYLQKIAGKSLPLANSTAKSKQLKAQKWLQRSQKFQAQGNYTEACRCLYFALLQHLDEVGMIPQQDSRTDREYRQLVTPLPDDSLYQILINTHEELCFGLQTISPEKLTQCHQALETIMQNSPPSIPKTMNHE